MYPITTGALLLRDDVDCNCDCDCDCCPGVGIGARCTLSAMMMHRESSISKGIKSISDKYGPGRLLLCKGHRSKELFMGILHAIEWTLLCMHSTLNPWPVPRPEDPGTPWRHCSFFHYKHSSRSTAKSTIV